MLRFLIDEQRIVRLLENLPDDSVEKLQAALDKVVIPDIVEIPVEQLAQDEAAVSQVEGAVEVTDDVVPDAFADEPVAEGAAPAIPDRKGRKVTSPHKEGRVEVGDALDEEEGDVDVLVAGGKPGKGEKKKKKKELQQRRQLIFDEEIGQVIAKRRRKGGRAGDDWGDLDE